MVNQFFFGIRLAVIFFGNFLPGRAVFFLIDRSRVIFHFAASDQSARETGAMFLLIDSFIREHAGQALTLDFEGSNDPNVGRFYKSFGATECIYHMITINRLPWILKKGLDIRKRIL